MNNRHVLLGCLLGIAGYLNAMETGQVKNTITIQDVKTEQFDDFQGNQLQETPIEMLQSDDVSGVMKRYGVSKLPECLINKIHKKLNNDDAPLCSVTKGRRTKKDPTAIFIKTMSKYVNTQDENLKLQNTKMKEEQKDRAQSEKQKGWLIVSNMVSWGANCCLGCITCSGTLAALGLTIAQAVGK